MADEQSANGSQSNASASNCVRSDVWQFFKKSGEKLALCKLCNKEYVYHRGTSNLRDHLTRSHPNDFSGHTQKHQQYSLDLCIARSKCPDSRAKRITDLIVRMVARDLLSAAMVEGDGFRALLKYLEPGYKVPSPTHVAEMVRRKHEACKQALKERLQTEAAKLAITTDIWNSCANDGYISSTAHYIVLHCLGDGFLCIGNQSVSRASHGCQHDQASNMQLAGEMLNAEVSCGSLNCAAHRLQLCVEEGLAVASISRAVRAAKKLVTHF